MTAIQFLVQVTQRVFLVRAALDRTAGPLHNRNRPNGLAAGGGDTHAIAGRISHYLLARKAS
jgi:hypothetical protein